MKPPSLKRPAAKPPALLANLYYDLRDRHLLPLIALVLVAIVATPILLGQGSETELPPAAVGAISALKEESRDTSRLTVVEAKPGLRDYHKRLGERTPTNPFKQRYTAPVLKGAELNEATEGEGDGGSNSDEKKTSSDATDGGSGAGGGAATPGGDGKPHAILYTFGVNLTIVHSSGSEADGDKKTSEPEKRERVLPTTVLPGEKTQVVTYMGLSPKTRTPLFLVSNDVTGVFGDGECVSGSESCQLIELEPGFPEIFEYGEDGDRYNIKVTNVELVVKGRV